jgi:hypothetical protein
MVIMVAIIIAVVVAAVVVAGIPLVVPMVIGPEAGGSAKDERGHDCGQSEFEEFGRVCLHDEIHGAGGGPYWGGVPVIIVIKYVVLFDAFAERRKYVQVKLCGSTDRAKREWGDFAQGAEEG